MHYDSLAFSKNGRETLVAKEPGMTSVIGSAIDFSQIEWVKIKFKAGYKLANIQLGKNP